MQYLIFLMYYVTSQIVNTPTDAFEQSLKLKNKKKVENTQNKVSFFPTWKAYHLLTLKLYISGQ